MSTLNLYYLITVSSHPVWRTVSAGAGCGTTKRIGSAYKKQPAYVITSAGEGGSGAFLFEPLLEILAHFSRLIEVYKYEVKT